MRAVAIKKSSREKVAGFQEMGTLRCDGCGEDFFIGHNPASVDKWVAEKHYCSQLLAGSAGPGRASDTPTESVCSRYNVRIWPRTTRPSGWRMKGIGEKGEKDCAGSAGVLRGVLCEKRSDQR